MEYDRLKAELNSLEVEKGNSAEDSHQLCNEISGMKTTVDQPQLTIRESKEEKAKLELQKIRLQNFVNDFLDNKHRIHSSQASNQRTARIYSCRSQSPNKNGCTICYRTIASRDFTLSIITSKRGRKTMKNHF